MEQKINGLITFVVSVVIGCSSIVGYADTSCQVAPIKKGQVAPCDGFYFNKDAENQAEQYRSDSDFYKKLSDANTQKVGILEDENDVLQKRLNLYIQESKDLSKAKARSETTETLIRIGAFTLGVFMTAMVVRNVRQ